MRHQIGLAGFVQQAHFAARTPCVGDRAYPAVRVRHRCLLPFLCTLRRMALPDRCTRRLSPELDQPNTWTASNLVALGHTHKMLILEFNCVESVQDPPADAAQGDDADERDGDGPRPAEPLPLPPQNKLASQQPQRMKMRQMCANGCLAPGTDFDRQIASLLVHQLCSPLHRHRPTDTL